ncbi:MAG: hypothetical protein ACI861_001462 [Paracoccaceae bacterium]
MAVWLCATILYIPFFLPAIERNDYTITPTVVTAIPALAFSSFTVALFVSIVIQSRLPFRTLLHPTRARVIGAIGLWVLLPIGVFLYAPVSAAAMVAMAIMGAMEGFAQPLPLFLIAAALLATLLYVVACLLSSGLPDWRLRFFAYCLVWWAAYLGFLLHSGFLTEL